MPRTAPQLDLTLPPRPSRQPARRWLYDAIRTGILDGRLPPGMRLPATRDLARQYRLARGTAVAAFEQLKAEGYLEAAVGSGTRVARVLPEWLLQVASAAPRTGVVTGERGPPLRLSGYGRRVQLFRNLAPGPVRAFRANQPALDLFPATLWAQVVGRRLRRVTTGQLLSTGPMGYPPLQRAIAEYLTTSRGVRCEAGQVAVVSGVQQALDLVARLFLDPGDRVALENPGYSGARMVFEACGATVVPLAVDREGMSLQRPGLRRTRLVYVTPAHQFPVGVTMSLARRLALLEWAHRAGTPIIEDDYDSEFRYAGRPMPALQGLDRHGRVLFTGSFSKVLFPALRLGYLVVPPDLVDPVAAALSLSLRHAPLLPQAVLADFIAEGHFGRHLRRMREVYAGRLAVLLEEAERQLAGRLEIAGVEAGLQTAGWLPRGVAGQAAVQAAAERGVEVEPVTWYARSGTEPDGLVLGFAAVDPPEIRRGVGELAAALGSLRGLRPRSGRGAGGVRGRRTGAMERPDLG